MTLNKAESITGYTIVRLDLDDGFYFEAHDGPEKVCAVGGKTESEGLESLVRKVYLIHSEIVRKRQQYRCADCSKFPTPLQVHHKIFRSHGRDDRVSNLKALCPSCHERAHGTKENDIGTVTV